MSTDGPKRTSTEPTIAIDRAKLPPISVREVAAMGLDVDHPETQEILARNLCNRQEAQTLVPCPRCQRLPCMLCDGIHMVSVDRARAWVAEHDALTTILSDPADNENDEPPDEVA